MFVVFLWFLLAKQPWIVTPTTTRKSLWFNWSNPQSDTKRWGRLIIPIWWSRSKLHWERKLVFPIKDVADLPYWTVEINVFNERRSNLLTSISKNSCHLQDPLHGWVIMGRRSCTDRQLLDLSGIGIWECLVRGKM